NSTTTSVRAADQASTRSSSECCRWSTPTVSRQIRALSLPELRCPQSKLACILAAQDRKPTRNLDPAHPPRQRSFVPDGAQKGHCATYGRARIPTTPCS